MITRLTFDQISTAVHDAYEACKDIKGGQNAHYIPYLANINPSLFGISLCLPDGRLISVGDTDYRFGIESVSKVHTAILALEQHGLRRFLTTSAPTPRGCRSTPSSLSCWKTTGLPRRS